MIRSLSLLLISFLQFALVMASPFQLTLEVSPEESGSVYPSSGQFEAGNSIQLSAYPSLGFVFKGWYEGNKKISSLSEFSYVMPAKNVVLQARFEFDPDVPDNPAVDSTEQQQKEYKVEVVAKPAGTGSFNNSLFSGKAGCVVSIVPYPDSKYSFSHWENEKGEKLSSKDKLDYVIPHRNTKVYGVFEYDPPVPSNPGTSQWDATSGRLALFEFKTGKAMSAIDDAIGGSNNRAQVNELIVFGRMTNQDWGFARYLTNCATFDLSRANGVEGIPDYAFDSSRNLQKILLPSCIEKIGYEAFYNCSQLTDITCYAITPPLVEEGAFYGVSQNVVVKVLPASLGMYAETAPWSKFTLVPMTDDTHALTLSLPTESADGRYKNMLLELVNQKSGQCQRYVVNDRLVYAFYGLLKGETFSLQLKTSQGVVLSELTELTIGEEDLNVTFDQIQSLQQVTLKVTTPSGEDVTSKTKIVWTDAKGIYLKQGASVEQLTANTVLNYAVTFDGALGLEYKYPEEQNYVVQEKDNQLVLLLAPLAHKTIFGQIKSKQGGAIEKAVVTVSQKVNGAFMQSFVTKTDREGRWSLKVFDAPTTVTLSADDFVSKSIEVSDFGEGLDMGTCELQDITGAVIGLNLTYQSAQFVGETISQPEWYSDHANVNYRIYNKTKHREISAFSVQYPRIVLLEEVEIGDCLEITAYSVKNDFSPVRTSAIISENNNAEANFKIVGLGAIHADFASTDNEKVVAILYNSKGDLVKKINYVNTQAKFGDLSKGKYTLVSMANSSLFSSISRLSQLKASGLVEGSDFVQNEVEVTDGLIQKLHNKQIPLLDESKLYYTSQQTSFSANKSNITVGNYLTLSSQIDFKSPYLDKVLNVKLIVDLPQSVDFVDNSVLHGKELSKYIREGQRIIVNLGTHFNDKVKFCVIPTMAGEFHPSAFVEFTIDGKTILQPIGAAYFEVKNLSINVPSVVAQNEILVSGTAMAHSQVTIYDGNQVIGETETLGNGVWNAVCQFDNPYNLSKHEVSALIKTKQGLELKSVTKTCAYNKNVIRVNSVLMSFYNGWEKKNKDVLFDFLNKKVSPSSYSFYTGTDFTFVVDFTNNDPLKVHQVEVCVFTDKKEVVKIPAVYDEKIKKWVAIHRFESSNLPVNLSVNFIDSAYKIEISSEQLSDSYGILKDVQYELQSFYEQCDEYKNQIENELSKETFDFDHVQELYDSYFQILGIEKPILDDNISITPEDVEKIQAQYDNFKKEYDLGNLEALLSAKLTDIDFSNTINDSIINFKTTTCDGYVESLLDSTYTKIATTQNFNIYVKSNDNETTILDFHNNICYHISLDHALFNTLQLKSSEDFVASMQNYLSTLQNKIEKIKEIASNIFDIADEIENHLESGLKFAREGHVPAWLRLQKLYKAKAAGEFVNPARIIALKLTCEGYEAEIRALTALKGKVAHFNSKFYKSIFGAVGIVSSFLDCKKDLEKFIECYYSVPMPCEKDQVEADRIQRSIRFAGIAAGLYYIGNITSDVCALFSIGPSVAAAPATAGSSFGVALVAVGKLLLSAGIQANYQWSCKRFFENTYIDISALECSKEPEEPEEPNHPDGPDEDYPNPPLPPIEPIHDPAGYVYEGVSSNRLEGVMASCYYKELVEDMYGDKHENIVLWNAEDYAQKNPLFTDENGMYRWDVPQGLWQVKFEKEGYQTTYSDWLPVPPPQLEVNIPMTQQTQPMVVNARAYEEGVEVEFDKYMNPASFDLATVRVLKNGKAVDGTLKMLNEERMNEYTQLSFASKIRFVPAVPFLGTDKVNLIVSRKVKSYAGITMAEDYSQEFDIVKEIKAIVADSICEVLYGGEREIVVSALPYDAAVGKTITAHTTSPMIATVTNEAVVDENGQARFTINGELPGAALLEFTIQDVTTQGRTEVNVVRSYTYLNAPKASLPSGTEVFKNTKVVLTTDRDDVVIYYTLNGSCPCDAGALVYKEPIVIDHDNVHIKAMAVDKEGNESAIVEFVYSIRTTSMAIDLATGWNWVSHNLDEAIELPQSSSVSRIRSQVAEAVKDPVSGWDKHFVMRPEEAYKVQTTTEDWLELSADLFNARDKQISLAKGWNWIGYPMEQIMTVGEALAKAQPSLGDILVGFEGFAEYTAEGWLGTLDVMVPGQGYLYKAVNDGAFKYNTDIVSMAQSLHQGKNEPRGSIFPFDAHAYPDVMPVTTTLLNDGIEQLTDNYFAVALCGEDCRGEGVFVDGRWLFTIHGNEQEDINFVFIDKGTGEMVAAAEAVQFVADNLGTYEQPFALHIGAVTGIEKQCVQGCTVTPLVAHDKIHVSLNGEQMDRVSLMSTNGRVVLVQQNCGSTVEVNVAELPSGTYVVTAVAGGKNYYKKIIKK